MEQQPITLDDLRRQKDGSESTRTTVPTVQELERQTRELSAEDRAKVDDLRQNINLLNSAELVTYGVAAQRNVTQFADTILDNVSAKEAGAVGEQMTDLLVTVQSLDINALDGKKDWRDRLPFASSLRRFQSRFDTVSTQIDKIENELETSRDGLLRDITIFDQLYEQNLHYFRELELYIEAGVEKVEEARRTSLPALRDAAVKSGDQMDAQRISDFEDTVDRFERKLHDMRLTRTIAIQTAPQIRLIQNNDKALVDKIQTSLYNTIPLWKNQIVIALGLQNQEDVLKMQRMVNDTTNELLRKNSEMLKQNTIETAKESERSIVDIETLKKTNQDLISTIEETLKIHQEGRAARQRAELELVQIENELKQTLMANSSAAPAATEATTES